jgi:phosphatidylserine decarboxylase
MDEKGMFKFGGSTVILVMETDKINFDRDLIENSARSLETLVRCGEKIGTGN